MIGAIQQAPMTFCSSLNSYNTLLTYSSTVNVSPTAKDDKFLAAPNPPGKITASKSFACNSLISLTFPRTIRADSSNIFLLFS